MLVSCYEGKTRIEEVGERSVRKILHLKDMNLDFFLKDPIYLQSVTIHSANGGKGEGWHVEEYSVALLC
jgi:hypothetical protein